MLVCELLNLLSFVLGNHRNGKNCIMSIINSHGAQAACPLLFWALYRHEFIHSPVRKALFQCYTSEESDALRQPARKSSAGLETQG